MKSSALAPKICSVQSYCGNAVQTMDVYSESSKTSEELQPDRTRSSARSSVRISFLFMGQSFLCTGAAGTVEQCVGKIQTELVQLFNLCHQVPGSSVTHMQNLTAAVAFHMHMAVTALTTYNLVDRLSVTFTGETVNGTGLCQSREQSV